MKNCLVVANITFKEIVRQPIFYVVMFGCAVLMFLSSSFALFAFGEEGKLVKDMGTATITISGLLIAVFYTASAFTDELKKTTVVTILCKPVNKSAFIIGRFAGTALVVLLIDIILVVAFILIASYYNESGHLGEYWRGFFGNIYSALDNNLLLGVYFAFLKVLILGAISLLLSVNLTAVSNISICFFVYIFGHLKDNFGLYLEESEGVVKWLLKIVFTIIPNLQFFDMGILKDDTIRGYDVSVYLLVASLYAVCYCSIMIVFTILYFQRKDI